MVVVLRAMRVVGTYLHYCSADNGEMSNRGEGRIGEWVERRAEEYGMVRLIVENFYFPGEEALGILCFVHILLFKVMLLFNHLLFIIVFPNYP